MKLAILTLPLDNNNYGGILQNYALQTVLKRLGHDVVTVNLILKPERIGIRILNIIKRIIKKYLFRESIDIKYWLTEDDKKIINYNTRRFIKERISLTIKIDSIKKLKLLNKYNFDGYIVGSDQCWRPKYSPLTPTTFFLDFLACDSNHLKIAYSVSFGVDKWELSKKNTKKCTDLIKSFNAISVREESAVKLCNKFLGVEAVHLVDPTMLLEQKDYLELIEQKQLKQESDILLSYILDRNKEKENIINSVSKSYKMENLDIMPKSNYYIAGRKNLNDCVFPGVDKWLAGFVKANFVITDSFHGTVFSILFNKPFIAIGNKDRGLDRFLSLLKIFNLENRLVYSVDNFDIEICNKPIDYQSINSIIAIERQKAFSFLVESLRK